MDSAIRLSTLGRFVLSLLATQTLESNRLAQRDVWKPACN